MGENEARGRGRGRDASFLTVERECAARVGECATETALGKKHGEEN